MLVASGARTGGYALFVQDDRLVFTYNRLGRYFDVVSEGPLPEGPQEVAVRFTKTGEHEGVATLAGRRWPDRLRAGRDAALPADDVRDGHRP